MVTFLHRLPNSGDVAQANLCRDLVFERSAKIAQQCKKIREDKVDMTSRPPGLISDYIVLLRDNKPPRRQFPTAGDQTMDAFARLRYIMLSSLYLFSVEMEDSTSAQIVFRAIVDNFHFIWPNGFRYHPGSDVINHVYYYTLAWDPLRYFLADCYVDFANIKWYIPTGTSTRTSWPTSRWAIRGVVALRMALPELPTRGTTSSPSSSPRPQPTPPGTLHSKYLRGSQNE